MRTYMRTYGVTLAACCLVSFLAMSGLVGCGEEEPPDVTETTARPSSTTSPVTTAEVPVVITVEEALSAEGPVRVMGAIIATYPQTAGGGEADDAPEPTVVLTAVVLESYPPQPGGATMPVVGLDLEDLVGLTSTVGESGMAPVTWSDYRVVLGGDAVAGTLEVTATPGIIEATSAELRVRFSSPAPPLVSGDPEWWVFDVRNDAEGSLDLMFSSGQQAELILSQDGQEVYRWSEGKMFTQALETVTLAPGEVHCVVLNDEVNVPPGRYDLTAAVTANAAVGGRSVALPTLEGVVDVF